MYFNVGNEYFSYNSGQITICNVEPLLQLTKPQGETQKWWFCNSLLLVKTLTFIVSLATAVNSLLYKWKTDFLGNLETTTARRKVNIEPDWHSQPKHDSELIFVSSIFSEYNGKLYANTPAISDIKDNNRWHATTTIKRWRKKPPRSSYLIKMCFKFGLQF